MMLLFDLPRNFIAQFLSEWIFTDSLTKFDSAIQWKKYRVSYLELITTPYFVSNGINATSFLPFSCVCWLIRRSIKIKRLCLTFGLADDKSILELDLSKIECLDFTNAQFKNKNNVAHLLDKCTESLRELNFSGNDLVTSAFLRAIMRKCVKLHTLNISNCTGISDVAVKRNAPFCRSLTSLDISRCQHISTASLHVLAAECKQLTFLDIASCSSVSDAAIAAICTANAGVRRLSLGFSFNLTDSTIRSIATRCSEVQILDLNCCARLTDTALFFLAEHCRHLTSLNVACCANITDEGVLRLVELCRTLTELNISNCTRITDTAVAGVAVHGAPHLASLNLTGCHLVTHSAAALLSQCRCLRSLYLNNCCKVRDHTAVLQLLQGCACLGLLDLRGTTVGHREEIQAAATAAIRSNSCANLETLEILM